jgi:hypothetical protein
MIGRTPRHTSFADDVDPGGLFVFIPGALASGFLISMGLLIGDALRTLRGDIGAERRVAHTGAAMADEVRAGAGASRQTQSGLRPRWVYGIVSAVSFGLALLVIPGATWNFFNPGGYISNISWIWAVSMVLTLGVAILGVRTLHLAPEWLPVIIGMLGLGFAARFLFGSELIVTRTALVTIGLIAGAVGMATTWHVRRDRNRIDIPPSVRPLLARTPLSRAR